MRKKTTVIIITFISAFIIMSSGYGLWQKELTIVGNITVKQDPEVAAMQELVLQEQMLKELALSEDVLLPDQTIDNEEKVLKGETVDSEESIIEEESNNAESEQINKSNNKDKEGSNNDIASASITQ